MHVCVCVFWTDKQLMAQTVTNSSSSHCFMNLEPERLYRISVHSLLGTAEGAAVSILHPTGLIGRTHCETFFLF